MNTKVCVCSTVYYQDTNETRFYLACQMIGDAVAAGHNVILVDGSPIPKVASALTAVGAVVFPQMEKGMGASRREVFRRAAEYAYDDIDAMLWIEPEKVDLVRLIPQIVAPIASSEADIVVPARTFASFSSYPTFQAESELAANQVFAEATGRELDVMFGPVLFARSLLSVYAGCDPNGQYGVADGYIQQIATMVAMSSRYRARVVSVPIDFYYPPIQRAEEVGNLSMEMRTKRIQQFDALTNAFRVVAKKLNLRP